MGRLDVRDVVRFVTPFVVVVVVIVGDEIFEVALESPTDPDEDVLERADAEWHPEMLAALLLEDPSDLGRVPQSTRPTLPKVGVRHPCSRFHGLQKPAKRERIREICNEESSYSSSQAG